MLLAQAAGPFVAALVLSGQGATTMILLMALLVAAALGASLRLPSNPKAEQSYSLDS